MSTETPNTLEGIAEEEPPTCPNGERFCPIDNAAVASHSLECFDCRLELARAGERPADAIRGL